QAIGRLPSRISKFFLLASRVQSSLQPPLMASKTVLEERHRAHRQPIQIGASPGLARIRELRLYLQRTKTSRPTLPLISPLPPHRQYVQAILNNDFQIFQLYSFLTFP